jgi:hypothetical protein
MFFLKEHISSLSFAVIEIRHLMSRFTSRAHEHEDKLIELIIVILWKGDQPIDL